MRVSLRITRVKLSIRAVDARLYTDLEPPVLDVNNRATRVNVIAISVAAMSALVATTYPYEKSCNCRWLHLCGDTHLHVRDRGNGIFQCAGQILVRTAVARAQQVANLFTMSTVRN